MPRAKKRVVVIRKQQKQKQLPASETVVKKKASTAKKKGPNPIARGLLGVVSGGANMLLPGSGVLVNALGKKLLNSLGLSEKVVLPADYNGGNFGGSDGGTIVASADAPVQFGREQSETSFLRYLHKGESGDVIVHTREPFFNVSTNAAANTLNGAYAVLYPFNTNLSIIKQIAGMYSWYRFLGVKLHYTHWAPTSTQVRVCIAHAPTETFNNGANVTVDEASKLEHVALGSAYEDFGLEFEPTCPLNWNPSYPTTAATTVLEKANGTVYSANDMNNVLSTTIGTVYLELITAFKEQRPISVTVGAILPLSGLVKRRAMFRLLNTIYSHFTEELADKLSRDICPWEMYDAIRSVRRDGVTYGPEYETLRLLIDRYLPDLNLDEKAIIPRASPFPEIDAVSSDVANSSGMIGVELETTPVKQNKQLPLSSLVPTPTSIRYGMKP